MGQGLKHHARWCHGDREQNLVRNERIGRPAVIFPRGHQAWRSSLIPKDERHLLVRLLKHLQFLLDVRQAWPSVLAEEVTLGARCYLLIYLPCHPSSRRRWRPCC